MAEEHAVSIKLPTFWVSQPEVWFVQAEAQFHLRKITSDETMYYYVLAALDQATAARFMDLISQPPTNNKYQALKTRLLDTFGLSAQERATRLLHFRTLGDSKPSALMDEMLALLGDHPPCFLFLFEQLFLERLPEDVQVHLAGAQFTDYRQLAKKADAYWVSRDTGFGANAIQQRTSGGQKTKVQPSTPFPAKMCYYHRTYGEAATKCRPPCDWSGKEQAGRQ